MFNKKLQKKSINPNFWAKLEPYYEWGIELAKRRDPAAHRMPLYIIPSMLSKDDAEKYSEYDIKAREAFQKLEYKVVDKCMENRGSLGSFMPFFAHEPEKIYPLYPTLPDDVYNLIQIANTLSTEIFN